MGDNKKQRKNLEFSEQFKAIGEIRKKKKVMNKQENQQDSQVNQHGICIGWTQDLYQQLKGWWSGNKSMKFKTLDDLLDSFPSEFVPTMDKHDLINIWLKCGMIDYSNNDDCWIKIKRSYFIVNGVCILDGDIKTLDKDIQHDLLLFLQEFIYYKGKVYIAGDIIQDTNSLLKYFN